MVGLWILHINMFYEHLVFQGLIGENNLERFLEIKAIDKITKKWIPKERNKCA